MNQNEIRVRIAVDNAQARRALADTAQAGQAMGNALRSIAASLAGIFSVRALTGLINQSLEAADNLNKLSQRIGISVEQLSTLVPVADLAGVAVGDFTTALHLLAKQQTDAAAGSKEAAAAFDALEVSAKAKGGLKSLDQLLLDLADKFKALPDGAEKTALAMDLFGRSGAEMIPFLNQGREGIAALTDELHLLGVGLGSEAAAQAEAFNDSLDKIRKAVEGMANRITADMLPALVRMAEEFVASARDGGNLRNVIDGLGGGIKGLALGAVAVANTIAGVGEALGALFAAAFSATSGQAKTILADLEARLRERWEGLTRLKGELFDGDGQPAAKGPTPDKPPPTADQAAALARIRETLAAARAKEEHAGGSGKMAAAARQAAQEERQLAEALARVRDELGELTGTATDADRRAAIERGYADLKAKLKKAGDTAGLAQVNQLIDLKAWDAQLQAMEARWRQALETMQAAEQSANIQAEQGLISGAEARERIASAHAAAAKEMEEILPLLERAAAALGPQAQANVQQFKNALLGVKSVVNPLAAELETLVGGAFSSMFSSFVSGTVTAKQAFANFARSVIQGLAQIAANEIWKSLFLSGFRSLLGAFGLGGGAPVEARAGGGLITGPGSGTSDSIPARLSAGEYVVRSAAVRRVGVAYLDALNGLRLPPAVLAGGRLGYAAGGLVMPQAAGAGDQINISIAVDASGSAVSGDPGRGRDLARQLEAAVRGVIADERRPGGLLAVG